MPPKKSSTQQQPQQQPSAAASGSGSLLVEGGDPVASAIAIIEKKARNLEKRKVSVVSSSCARKGLRVPVVVWASTPSLSNAV